jgi:FtsH-binding integral membrane protein
MSYTNDNNPYAASQYGAMFAADAAAEERATFIRKTYLHLSAAIGAFVLIEFAIFNLVSDATLTNTVGWALGGWNWLFVLGAFMLVSWIANSWASNATSLSMQYAGLTLYVVAEALIFVPLLYIARHHAPSAIPSAAVMTGVIFGGLTLTVLITKADFSFLRMFLVVGGLGAFGFILCSIFFMNGPGNSMIGIIFSGFMVVLASGYILYTTSGVMHHYRTTQYVAAALALFAAVALLFWYILQLFLLSRD